MAPFLRCQCVLDGLPTNSDPPLTPSELRTKLIQNRFPSYETPGYIISHIVRWDTDFGECIAEQAIK